jgi:hypothetical protein
VFGVISLGNSFYEISFSSLEYVGVGRSVGYWINQPGFFKAFCIDKSTLTLAFSKAHLLKFGFVSMDYLKSIGTLRFSFRLLVPLGASNALMLLLAMSRPNIMVMTDAQANTNSTA